MIAGIRKEKIPREVILAQFLRSIAVLVGWAGRGVVAGSVSIRTKLQPDENGYVVVSVKGASKKKPASLLAGFFYTTIDTPDAGEI